MKIIIIGGHLSPALSVIEELESKNKILFLGRKYTFEADKTESLEYKIITDLKIPFSAITTARLQRKFTKHTVFSLFKFPIGFFQALSILHRFKPDVVLGFGGYLQIPVVFASFILNVPVVIHEQTLGAGFSNKISSFFAKKICISWETSQKFFPKRKTILTGNPIRREIVENSKFQTPNPSTIDKKLLLIYVTGGSSGSHFINILIEGCLKKLLKDFRIIHQTGDAKEFDDFNRLNNLRNKLDDNLKAKYELRKFISSENKLLKVYREAQMAISRAGINTATELIYMQKPSIVIPIPFSQDDEQLNNALYLKEIGLGEVLIQKDAAPEKFLELIYFMAKNINNYKVDKSKLQEIIKPNAAAEIIKILEHEKKKK